MSNRMAAFMAGFGKGAMDGQDKIRQQEREKKEDEWRDEQRDNARRDRADQDALKADLKDAAADRTVVDGTVTQAGGNQYLTTDPAQTSAMQDTLAAEAELRGDAAHTSAAGKGVVGNMARGNEIVRGNADAAELNAPDARNQRVVGALQKHGQIERAAAMENTLLDQQAKRLGLEVAQVKFADDKFNRRLTERLSTPNWAAEAAAILDETEVGGLAGVTVTSRPTKDGKSVEMVAARNGEEKVVATYGNDESGKAAFLKQMARAPIENKIGWIVEDGRAAKEDQRWQQTFDFNKQKEENDQQYRQRVLGLQYAQESRARATHAAAMEDAKIPPAVKLQAQSMAKQLETINSAMSKAMAEGSFDANNPASAELVKQQRILGLKYQRLLAPYTPGAGANADPLGLAGGKPEAAPAPGAGGAAPAARPGAAPASAQPPVQPSYQVGPGGGAVPGGWTPGASGAAPVAPPAASRPQASVADILAGPGASPSMTASAQQRAALVENLAAQLKTAQQAVVQNAQANPNGVGAAMADVATARAELTKALSGMNTQQAQQVLAAVGLQ